MTTFIGGLSALQLLFASRAPQWHSYGCSTRNLLEPTKAQPNAGVAPDLKRIKELGIPEGIITERLEVNVNGYAARRQSKYLMCRYWTGPTRGTYLKVDGEYCVLTPEACFAQLAGELSVVHLVELAMCLCGTVALAPPDKPTRYDVEPLTTPKKLQGYVFKLKGKRGLDNARAAAKLAAKGAGSPMEAKIATAFALGVRQGGFGVPAELNCEIELTAEARGAGYRNIRRPDLLWAKSGVALDYDSREFHDLQSRLDQDEQRRNELAAMDLKGIVARPHHFRNQLEFEQLVAQVFSAMDKPMKSEVRELPEKRARLFAELFGAKRWDPMAVR